MSIKWGIIFPGYGEQFIGMGKDMYDESRVMQEYFEDAAQCLDKNFVKLCFTSSEKEFFELENSTVALYLLGISIAALLKEKGFVPSVVAGYNSGEYAALSYAGSLTLPDALYLLRKTATLFQDLMQGKKFLGLRLYDFSYEEVKQLCEKCSNGNQVSYISVIENNEQYVVSGTEASIICMEQELKKLKKDKESVSVVGGLHSPLMDELLKVLKMYLEKVDFHATKIPFIAGVTGQALTDGEAVRAAVMQQIHAPIQWKKMMEAFVFCDVIVIAGPSMFLQQSLQKQYPDKKIMMIKTMEQLKEVCAELAVDEQQQVELQK